MQKSIEQLYPMLGYTFRDKTLLEQALTHRSVGAKNNERLEFLGDSILSYVISDRLFEQFPKLREGELTRLRSTLVKGETLAKIAKELQLGDYLRLGVGEMKSGGHRRGSILSDALEAIIAAIYLDSGIQQATEVVLGWYSERLTEFKEPGSLKDPKTQLQEICQARRLPLPEYQVMEVVGEQHNQTFTVECRIQGYAQATVGISKSRRRAEQEAANCFLQVLKGED